MTKSSRTDYMREYMRKYRLEHPEYVEDNKQNMRLKSIKKNDKKKLDILNNMIKENNRETGSLGTKDYYTLEELEQE